MKQTDFKTISLIETLAMITGRMLIDPLQYKKLYLYALNNTVSLSEILFIETEDREKIRGQFLPEYPALEKLANVIEIECDDPKNAPQTDEDVVRFKEKMAELAEEFAKKNGLPEIYILYKIK